MKKSQNMLAEQNGFDPTFWHCLLRLGKKAQQKLLTPAIEGECNEYDMTAALCF
jgi:hypothetical protein